MATGFSKLYVPEELRKLTPKQLNVYDHLMAGKAEKDIAVTLGASLHTVHSHIKQIYRKAGVTSQRELAGIVIARLGLLLTKLEAVDKSGSGTRSDSVNVPRPNGLIIDASGEVDPMAKKKNEPAKPLSNGEVEILTVVWQSDGVTASEVWEKLKKAGPLDRTTVSQRIRKMVDKGLLVVTGSGYPRRYTSGVQQKAAIERSLRDIMRRFFGGSSSVILKAFIADRTSLSAQEKSRLTSELAKFEDDQEP